MQVFVRIVTINCTEIYACNNQFIRLPVYTYFQRKTVELAHENRSIHEINNKYFYLPSIQGSDT